MTEIRTIETNGYKQIDVWNHEQTLRIEGWKFLKTGGKNIEFFRLPKNPITIKIYKGDKQITEFLMSVLRISFDHVKRITVIIRDESNTIEIIL